MRRGIINNFGGVAYSSILISFNLGLLLLVSTPKSPLINQLRELLLDEIIDFRHGSLKPVLGCTSNVEV